MGADGPPAMLEVAGRLLRRNGLVDLAATLDWARAELDDGEDES